MDSTYTSTRTVPFSQLHFLSCFCVQKIGCDVCQSKPSCSSYVPPKSLFDTTRPAPEKNLGSLVECKPSQAEIWTTDGYFKVGDAAHQPAESRPGCPSERRKPKY